MSLITTHVKRRGKIIGINELSKKSKIKIEYQCDDCKKIIKTFYHGYINNHSKKELDLCASCNQKGPRNKRFEGTIFTNGYKLIYYPQHPNSNKRGYIKEHRIIIETYLKRFLKPIEIVHHIDRNRSNNNLENLHLFENQSEHITYHNLIAEAIKRETKRCLICH